MKKLSSVILAVILVFIAVPAHIPAKAAVQALWPLNSEYNEISTYFDESRNYSSYGHNGIDIPADYSTDIYAVLDGECISAGWMDAYGYLIILWHESLGIYTFYAHCSDTVVEEGQIVNKGDVIGHVGNTGQSQGAHLHFGICDTLLAGWPDPSYYDPMSYFTYDFRDAKCNCTEDYAGIYVTKNVSTFLNIRSGHGSEFAVVGQIAPDTEVTVTKADGEWAHVEYNGISGFCAMEYLEKKQINSISDSDNSIPTRSAISISDYNYPDIILPYGKSFSLRGTLSSDIPITYVTGGIYDEETLEPVCVYETSPNAMTYEISGDIDNKMVFNSLSEGRYIYRIEAENATGKFCLIDKNFEIREDMVLGDLNGDNSVTIADAVLLENFLFGGSEMAELVSSNADMNEDGITDIFDMVIMRKTIIDN